MTQERTNKPGRKPVRKDLKRVVVGISVNPSTREFLERVRDEKGLTPGATIDKLVNLYGGAII